MRIATKLTILLLLAVSVVLAGFGYLRMRQERERLVEEVQQEAAVLTNAVRLWSSTPSATSARRTFGNC